MGNIASNPVDEATKQEVEEIIKAVLGTFTLEYVKASAIYMVIKAKLDAQAPVREYRLLEREPSTGPRLTGWLTKEGAIRKNWKRRYFIVRSDYIVDYYESEEEAKKENGKKKGSMALCGYSVNSDPNNTLLNRLKGYAEKLGMDLSELPKPKEYPPNTLEVYHNRRRPYYITADNPEDFKKWVEEFQQVCRRAYGLKNKEWVHEKAFHEAVRKTRWSLGRWGWWTYGGSEEQILSDMIVDQLDWVVMGRIYGKISGPYVVRNKVRNMVIKALDSMVMAAVTPAWAAMAKAVDELRPKIEPTLKELGEPLGKLESELVGKIKDGIMSVVSPILAEHVTPHLGRVVSVIKSPMVEAYDEAYRIFQEHVNKQDEHLVDVAGKEKAYSHLNWLPHSWEMWKATERIDVMYEPLWDLRLIFSDIYPWNQIWKGRDLIRSFTDNAVYTYEQRLDQEAVVSPDSSHKVLAAVMEDFRFDGHLATRNYYASIMKDIIMPPFNALVRPACKAILEPIAGLVPEPMKDLVDVMKLFDDVINGVIDDAIAQVLDSDQPSSSGKGKEKEIELSVGGESSGAGVEVSVTVEVDA